MNMKTFSVNYDDDLNDFEYVDVARHIPRAQRMDADYFDQSGLSTEYFMDPSLVFRYPHTWGESNFAVISVPYADHIFKAFG